MFDSTNIIDIFGILDSFFYYSRLHTTGFYQSEFSQFVFALHQYWLYLNTFAPDFLLRYGRKINMVV